MIEVLSSELLLKSYRVYTEWVAVHRNLRVARLHFLGGKISETSEPPIKQPAAAGEPSHASAGACIAGYL